MNETMEILKVDEAGRVRTPREKQEEMLDGFERSGMTGMQFARHIGVKYPTLMYWVGRRRRERREAGQDGSRPQWLEAVMESEGSAGGGLVVEVAGGLRLIVGEGQVKMAGELLRVLGFGLPC